MIAVQEPGMTTTDCRNNGWGLLVALDATGSATGVLYLDDGESLVPQETTWVNFFAAKGSLIVEPKGNYVDKNPLGNVTVMGVPTAPAQVRVDGEPLEESLWTYSADTELLFVNGLDELFSHGAWHTRWALSWS